MFPVLLKNNKEGSYLILRQIIILTRIYKYLDRLFSLKYSLLTSWYGSTLLVMVSFGSTTKLSLEKWWLQLGARLVSNSIISLGTTIFVPWLVMVSSTVSNFRRYLQEIKKGIKILDKKIRGGVFLCRVLLLLQVQSKSR